MLFILARLARPLVAAYLFTAVAAFAAEFSPEAVYLAEGRKTEAYITAGVISGGDRNVTDVIVTGLRRANNGKFERVVIDLAGASQGESASLPKPPFFQAGVDARPKRVSISVWGSPILAFDSRKVMKEFKRSKVISKIELLPNLDGESWTFSMDLPPESAVEVFSLVGPNRIIVDIRSKK